MFVLAPGKNSPSPSSSGSWYKVNLKLKTLVEQSGIHLLHDSQQLQRNMVSYLREKNTEKFQLNVFNFFCCKAHSISCSVARQELLLLEVLAAI